MFDIDSVITKLEKRKQDVFINEMHFEIEFAKALVFLYPQISFLDFEYSFSRRRIDLVFRLDEENIGIEFKYFTRSTDLLSADVGISLRLKNQVSSDLCRIGYWVDIAKLESALNKKTINSGYAILLTNDFSIFDKLDKNKRDFQFDISEGLKLPSRKEYYSKKTNRTLHKVVINGSYEFKTAKFKDLFLLVNKIGA